MNSKFKTTQISNKNNDFFKNVFDVVKEIPFGRVTSYGAIASYLGSKQASRMVGWALNSSHKFENIPAHRVVNRNGLLTGKSHFSDPNEMENKLKSEGIVISKNQVVDFNILFWNPSIELKL
jgi:methylated-DNA-protein-cysteine methyltransferase-like protein